MDCVEYFHDWTYDLEGKLVSVPEEAEEFPKLDKSCLGLKPASVDIWRSMIFVHPDPDAGSIMDWFGEVEPYLGPHYAFWEPLAKVIEESIL